MPAQRSQISSSREAQATLLARYAPDTRIRRMRWSQGETQRGIDGEEVR
jgi:hypothetical protein